MKTIRGYMTPTSDWEMRMRDPGLWATLRAWVSSLGLPRPEIDVRVEQRISICGRAIDVANLLKGNSPEVNGAILDQVHALLGLGEGRTRAIRDLDGVQGDDG